MKIKRFVIYLPSSVLATERNARRIQKANIIFFIFQINLKSFATDMRFANIAWKQVSLLKKQFNSNTTTTKLRKSTTNWLKQRQHFYLCFIYYIWVIKTFFHPFYIWFDNNISSSNQFWKLNLTEVVLYIKYFVNESSLWRKYIFLLFYKLGFNLYLNVLSQ